MRITGASIYQLRIPFVVAFSHSRKDRLFSDSIVVRLRTSDDAFGYGEGVARPYVTGETVATAVQCISEHLWPVFAERNLGPFEPCWKGLKELSEELPECSANGALAWNAARSAVELALSDCWLRNEGLSLGDILPPRRPFVTYSGVITAGSKERAIQHAKYSQLFGMKQLKVKIGRHNDLERVAAIRRIVGPTVSLRVDINGAYDAPQAIAILKALEAFRIDSAEQPVARGNPGELTRVRAETRIPLVVDESLVTIADADALITAKACDGFNLRISKCGGIVRTLQLAELATAAGLTIQLGSQVGETAILSAAGRHLAAHLEKIEAVEGSYGRLLLTDDISTKPVAFGHGGKGLLLCGPGLGITLSDRALERYSEKITRLGSDYKKTSREAA